MSLMQLVLKYVSVRTRQGRFQGKTPIKVRSVLMKFAESVGDVPPAKLTTRHVERWAESLAGCAPNTRRGQLSIVRVFCHWLMTEEVTSRDVGRDVQTPKMPRRVPRGLRTDAVAKVLDACGDAREALMVSLMVQEGLRCVEVSRLAIHDIDFNARLMLIVGKGGHERVLPLSDETWAALQRYLTEWPAMTGPLIRSYKVGYRGLKSETISGMVGAVMRRAGIKSSNYDGVSAHALRHTAASDMLRTGAHLRDVQAALGHASLATTQVYLPWIVKDLRSAMGGRQYRQTREHGFATMPETVSGAS